MKNLSTTYEKSVGFDVTTISCGALVFGEELADFDHYGLATLLHFFHQCQLRSGPQSMWTNPA